MGGGDGLMSAKEERGGGCTDKGCILSNRLKRRLLISTDR